MRAYCIILVLAVLLSSTLARRKACKDHDKQENAISATQKYLLRRYENGTILLNHVFNDKVVLKFKAGLME